MITSFGGDDDEEDATVAKNFNKSNVNTSEKAEIKNTLLSLKRLKQSATSARLSQSRSRSKSPVGGKVNTSAVSFRKSYSTVDNKKKEHEQHTQF